MSTSEAELLNAPHIVEYPYRRSVGPVMGAFFSALRDGKVVGVKTQTGRVLVPPTEYDPETGDAVGEMVPVASSGVVTTWSWVYQPRATHPLDHPFAWALVKLDGADTALLHAVEVDSPEQMQTGMRVQIRWRDERQGHIQDIACFEPEGA